MKAPRPLKPRTWRVTVTHEVCLPNSAVCLTGSVHNCGSFADLQPWAREEATYGVNPTQALDAPRYVPTGGVAVFEFASRDGSTVYHSLDASAPRPGAYR